ncbi:antibiotic biosynthesis monooxygenase family protein [Alkalimarinus sediminis]|uniref:Antibiotic biosynthesis monooxygenase n=1 Tax=Alkalimarinus sediminis TaxID=1632866 RepID=A0A9E8HKQ1_9ALTE|nr:antibiotic biosynthesis monooxygenase [Alkalimarinus sediminis]UZW76425.1 antibiotic biosynthesis monooxygenase [Alkalimarinus sediminis]
MIRVIIERHIAETLETTYEQAAKNTLQEAVSADGFISGESLRNANDPNHRLILSNWRSVQDWHRWFASEERKEMMNVLNPMLETEEKITILEQA